MDDLSLFFSKFILKVDLKKSQYTIISKHTASMDDSSLFKKTTPAKYSHKSQPDPCSTVWKWETFKFTGATQLISMDVAGWADRAPLILNTSWQKINWLKIHRYISIKYSVILQKQLGRWGEIFTSSPHSKYSLS